jgi:LmbE family N-acetylglucosaminyl deacetylase
MNSISSRNIAEQLCTLATLLEAEALRCKAYGASNATEVSRQARAVRAMADQLWDANVAVPVRRQPEQRGQAKDGKPARPSQPALDMQRAIGSLVL